MDYMREPGMGVMKREERGMDVNDITGKKKTLHGPGTLPPTGPSERVAPIRPRIMEYDIINPLPQEGRLRMSAYGKNVLDSRQRQRSTRIEGSPAAGKQMKAKLGEANIDQIWPNDEAQRKGFNERNRGLEAQDINHNSFNQRQKKLREADNQMIQQFLLAKERKSEHHVKPYKNASNVFTHLVDDPTTRQKVGGGRNSCRHPTSYSITSAVLQAV